MTKKLALDTEVVVIGNGPAGLSLSTFLSGWQPIYNTRRPHPDRVVHEHLSKCPNVSLLEQDLSWFQDECAERLNPTTGAYSALYDTLVRPTMDDSNCGESCLLWRRCWNNSVAHIVLGDSDIGGSWNNYDDDMVTVSLANWMDLPGLSLSKWLGGESALSRFPAAIIREYMKDYAKRMKIDSNFKPFTKVVNVTKFCGHSDGEYWQVEAVDKNGSAFVIKCKKVVLAAGQSHHRMLEVAGELNHPKVVYDLASMKQLLVSPAEIADQLGEDTEKVKLPVLVVGDGISAADTVLWCLANSVPVVQVIRRSDKQLRNIQLSRLSSTIYPEYAKVYRLMMRKSSDPSYRCLTSTQVISFDNEVNIVNLQTAQGIIQEKFKCAVVCVGRRANLDMLENKFEFLANYQSSSDESLFAIGSLAGDHFVRYLIGGAMQVAQNLVRSHKKCEEILEEEKQSLLISLQSVPSTQRHCFNCFLLNYVFTDQHRTLTDRIMCADENLCSPRLQLCTMIAE